MVPLGVSKHVGLGPFVGVREVVILKTEHIKYFSYVKY